MVDEYTPRPFHLFWKHVLCLFSIVSPFLENDCWWLFLGVIAIKAVQIAMLAVLQLKVSSGHSGSPEDGSEWLWWSLYSCTKFSRIRLKICFKHLWFLDFFKHVSMVIENECHCDLSTRSRRMDYNNFGESWSVHRFGPEWNITQLNMIPSSNSLCQWWIQHLPATIVSDVTQMLTERGHV